MLKNKPACCFVALALGISLFPALGPTLPLLCLAAAILLKKRFFMLLCTFALLGVSVMALHQPNQLELPADKLTLTGYVSEQVGPDSYNLRDVRVGGQRLNKMVRLYPDQPLRAGQVIQTTTQIEAYQPATNFGGIDWRQVMLGKGISHSAFASGIQITGHRTTAFSLFGALRQDISSGIEQSLGIQESALIKAILFGEKSGIDETVLADFRTSGLSHVLAISGLHIGILVAFFCFLVQRLRPGLKITLISLFLLCFLFLTSFSPSVLRAGLMALIWLYADLKGYRYNLLTSLFSAGCLILLYNPYNLYSAGFLLSFTCVLGIGLFYAFFYRHLGWFWKPIRGSIAMYAACQLGMFPVSIWFFNQVQAYSVLANIFAVPLVSFALVAALLGVLLLPLGLGYLPFVFSYSVLDIISYIARVIATLPLSVVNIPTPPLPLVLAFYGLLLATAIYYYSRRQAAIAAGMLLSGIMLLVNFHSLSKTPQITMLDVGDGLALHIRTSNARHILIDGSKELSDENVLVKYLRSIGANDLVLVCTHDDLDHYGGFLSVAREFRVDSYLSPVLQGDQLYNQLIANLKSRGANVAPFLAGSTLEWDGVTLQAIAPAAVRPGAKNENSLNAYVIIEQKTLLITGDTPIQQEVDYRKVDILQVAHHGSDTSTSDRMLEQTRPQVSLVSGDRYVSQSVLDRLPRYFSTQRDGAVRLFVQDQIRIQTKKGTS